MNGTAVFADHRLPYRLDYRVVCDRDWRTISGTVEGWFGKKEVALEITADRVGGWRMNGTSVPEVKDCVDLDLSFTPSTNLIPVRRSGLSVGGSTTERAAWLSVPELRLEPLEQIYRRSRPSTYRYESEGGYSTELEVNDAGFVVVTMTVGWR